MFDCGCVLVISRPDDHFTVTPVAVENGECVFRETLVKKRANALDFSG